MIVDASAIQRPGADEPGRPAGSPVATGRRRWRRWTFLVIALLLLGGFARFAWLRITLRPTPRPEYWAAKIAELDSPGAGAVSAKEAMDILTSRPWQADAYVARVFPVGMDDILLGEWDRQRADVAAADAVFQSQEYQETAKQLDQAVRAGWSDAAEPILASNGPWMYYRVWAKTLVAHSRWMRESRGPIDGCVTDWENALRLARQLRRHRVAISNLTALAIESLVANEMMHAALEPHAPLDTRALALSVKAIRGPALKPREQLAGERMFILSQLEHFFVREGGDWLDVSAAVNASGMRPPTPSRLWNLSSPIFHTLFEARANVERLFGRIDGFSDMKTCRSVASRAFSPEDVEFDAILDGNQFASLGTLARSIELGIRYETLMEAGTTMLALAERKRSTGQFPDSLHELIPTYAASVPIDRVDGSPLRYRRQAEGYVLYSIGLDGRDDGGRPADASNPLNWEAAAGDVVFNTLRRREPR